MKKIKCFLLTAAMTLSALAVPATNAEAVNINTKAAIFGDVNSDGFVTGSDVLELIKYFLNQQTTLLDSGFSSVNADLNRNKEVEITDLATLKQYTVGDTVSMSNRRFNAKTEKSDDNMLLQYTNRYVSTIKGEWEPSEYCAESYNDARERLKELGLESDESTKFLDSVNIPGSPSYDGVKSYDVVFICTLPDTDLGLTIYYVEMTPEIILNNLTNGELWATPTGLDIRDVNYVGDYPNNALAMFSVNLQTLYAAAEKYDYDMSDINEINCSRNGHPFDFPLIYGDQPVIYLYPEEETEVHVELEYEGVNTYPKYPEDSWEITAQPDGTLIDKNGNTHSRLFKGTIIIDKQWDFSEGFVVKGTDTASFLNEKLSYMGFTANECRDFINYWKPKMGSNSYNLISFQQENYTEAAKLTITPQPDSMQRVFMAFKALDEYIDVPAQELPAFERKGFTAIELGGTEVK